MCGVSGAIPDAIPMGPGNFDNQFGYTVYNTNNSQELALNNIRSMLADDNGLWVGYGAASDSGLSGVSYISNNLEGNRLWQYCTNIEGKPIGRLTNALAKGNDNALWVATDGAGIWRLLGGNWEQFVYNPQLNDYAPDQSTYALASTNNDMLVGDLDGITRWTGATWERILFNKQVVSLAVDAQAHVWVGYLNYGISLDPWENNHQDYNVGNGDMASNAVRTIAIDKKGQVWVGKTEGG